MCDTLNVSYDRFILTSKPDHYRASQAIWKAMEERGDLYLGRYEGWYSVRDEAYYDDDELTEGENGEKLSPQGTPVEWTVEESWFFRLSKYQQPLLDHYAANPDFIRPESRRNEVLRFVESGLSDLSISRTSFDWGVPVPDNPGHVMYVWLDALTNYITGLGYPDDTELWRRYWPADIHLIGKDVVRFHAIYWPAFLMSAGIALPKCVYGHGFLLSRGEKMSKSVGNVVDPMVLAERFGVDALRYFLLREVPFGQDGSYSAEAIVNRANAELANSFGNLAQRILSMIHKNLGGVLPAAGTTGEDQALLAQVDQACLGLTQHFERLAFSIGLEEWMQAVFACNAYVDNMAPWALKKTDPERMAVVLGTLVTAVRKLAVAVQPVIPASAEKLIGLIDSGEDGAPIAQPTPLFPRLELEEEEAA
jgi:methionyl-tRNA synthetase